MTGEKKLVNDRWRNMNRNVNSIADKVLQCCSGHCESDGIVYETIIYKEIDDSNN